MPDPETQRLDVRAVKVLVLTSDQVERQVSLTLKQSRRLLNWLTNAHGGGLKLLDAQAPVQAVDDEVLVGECIEIARIPKGDPGSI